MDIALIVLGIVFVISAASYLISKLVKRQEAQTSIAYPFIPQSPPSLPRVTPIPPQVNNPVRVPAIMAPTGQTIYDFPKCYICRQRNYRGEQQRVFWDSAHNYYRCSRGHTFTGKE